MGRGASRIPYHASILRAMYMLRSLAPVLTALFAFAPFTHAQEALRDLYSTSGFVRSAAIAGDTLYVGGDFITVGPPTGPAAVIDKVTGEADLAQARIGGGVDTILPDGRGGWYVGGEIEWAGGEPRRNLAHFWTTAASTPRSPPILESPAVPSSSAM